MFERLLAALIILALLVLVMFIAFPDPSGRRQSDIEPTTDQTALDTPAVKPDPQPEQPPVPVVPAPSQTAEKTPDRVAPGAGDPPVPNPSGEVTTLEPAATPTRREAKREEITDAPPRQKIVKIVDRLPQEPRAAPSPRPEVTPRQSKAAPKTDSFTTIERDDAVRVSAKDDRRRDDIGTYLRRTVAKPRKSGAPPRWRRTHYYECTGGDCSCDCDRPYWSRRGDPEDPCWD
jgi:hypothetical protein